MIKAVHTLIYSDDPEATRAFLRDVLGWPSVAEPGGTPPWPIFKTGPSEMGVHPTSGGSGDDAYASPRHHSISLMCDDIAATKAELERMRERATAEIDAEKQRAIGELRGEVADLALAAASRVVGETISTDRERRLVQEFLAETGTGSAGSGGSAGGATS